MNTTTPRRIDASNAGNFGRLTAIILISLLAACQSSSAPTPQTALPIVSSTELAQPTATGIPYESPEWFQDAVLYEIFVRSFFDSDADGIGDLAGITEKIPYLKDLGVEVIWLMPIFPSPSEHGYDVTDFFGVNPDYGSIEDLQALITQLHAQDINIILDFVPSHLSSEHPLFQSAFENPGSEKEDWFVFTDENNTKFAGFANNTSMPRFNHFNPEVVDYLTEAAFFWLDMGVDGFRIDNATFPPQEFFLSLRQSIKATYPDALLLGEAWLTNPRDLSIYYTDQFDALFDFPFYDLFQGNPNSRGDGVLNGKGFAGLFPALISQSGDLYPNESLQVRFLSNHDTDRIATEVRNDPDRQALAIQLLASMPGPLMLYYGEEIGMLGQKGTAPHWDNYRRAPMDWYAIEAGEGQTNWFMLEDRWNAPLDGISVEEQRGFAGSLLEHYQQMLALRSELQAFSNDNIEIPIGDWSNSSSLAFLRGNGNAQLLALYNFSDEASSYTMPSWPLASGTLIDIVANESLVEVVNGQEIIIELPATSGRWIIVR